MKKHFYKTLYLFILLFSLSQVACKKSSDDQQPVQQPTTTTKVTEDNYNLITVGMSYTQVVNILGTGTLIGTNTYRWSADNTNTITITIIFTSANIVQTRSQVGLISTSTGTPTGGCSGTYNGHQLYTGPRGGCYYINSNGNKTYI
jgi:hypothetical protein